jgi:TM2 domain-containing membrane protein YozV
MEKKKKNELLAGLLSFIYPGIGQIYCFHIFWAIFWIIFTSGIWVAATPFAFILHLIAAMQAYKQALRRNEAA